MGGWTDGDGFHAGCAGHETRMDMPGAEECGRAGSGLVWPSYQPYMHALDGSSLFSVSLWCEESSAGIVQVVVVGDGKGGGNCALGLPASQPVRQPVRLWRLPSLPFSFSSVSHRMAWHVPLACLLARGVSPHNCYFPLLSSVASGSVPREQQVPVSVYAPRACVLPTPAFPLSGPHPRPLRCSSACVPLYHPRPACLPACLLAYLST